LVLTKLKNRQKLVSNQFLQFLGNLKPIVFFPFGNPRYGKTYSGKQQVQNRRTSSRQVETFIARPNYDSFTFSSKIIFDDIDVCDWLFFKIKSNVLIFMKGSSKRLKRINWYVFLFTFLVLLLTSNDISTSFLLGWKTFWLIKMALKQPKLSDH